MRFRSEDSVRTNNILGKRLNDAQMPPKQFSVEEIKFDRKVIIQRNITRANSALFY